MADAVKVFFLILSALFPIVDPITGSPFFLLATRDYSPQTRRELSQKVAVDSFFLMIGSYFVGSHVLGFFGVSLPVVQVGGGLVLVAMGWSTLMRPDPANDPSRRGVQAADALGRAFYPLTLPLTVGPGSISVAITLGANSTHRYGAHILIILAALLATAAIAVSVFICYAFADRLARMLGPTSMEVIIRLSSFLLLCIGVQIVWNGLSALLATVPLHMKG